MNNPHSGQYFFAFWILFIGLFFNITTATAQTGTVSVEFKNASPKDIIDNLESRTPYRFIYQDNINLDSPKVTLKKDNVSIDDLLEKLQELTGLNFRRNENNIAINKPDTEAKKKRLQGISGKIVDNYGIAVFDAIIVASPGNVTVFTDTDGDFTLELESGFYDVEITAQSFAPRFIQNIPVDSGNLTPLNLVLELNQNITLEEVTITGQQYKSTESTEGLLLQQKRAAQMSDGISAEQIGRTPDNNVGSTLKRITGVTTIDDRYVVVRSMGERWNQAMMDGISLPSTEVTQQSFSFDIIPTAMVQSIVVNKTATPDMYANFAGGNIEVKTKDIPKENFTSISISNSYNNRSTFKDFLTKQRGEYDYFGFDDGTRDYPDFQSYPVPVNEAESGPFFEESKKFTQDNFTTYKDKAMPNTSFQLALGRVYNLNEGSKWGFSGSLLFRNTQSKQVIDHTSRGVFKPNAEFFPEGIDYDFGDYQAPLEYPVLKKYGYKNSGGIYTYNSTFAGMLNGGVQFGNNKITIRNTLIHIYDNQLTQITGWDGYGISYNEILDGSTLPITKETDYPVYTDFFQTKVEGNHRFKGYEFNWFGAVNSTTKKTKDATFLTNQRERLGDDVLVYTEVYNSANNVRRRNFNNDETDYNIAFNINKSLNFNNIKNNVKIGYFGTFKTATNKQESANLQVIGQNSDRVRVYNLHETLSGSYYYYGGFGWLKTGTYGNRYEGEVITHSPFIMLDNRIGDFLRIVWGLRAESYDYNEISNQSEAEDFALTESPDKLWQYLPSVNITYSPAEKINIRLGYYKSVLRPQFSERLQIPYYDPVYEANIINFTARGGILSSVANNYDFKLEWFPSLGQILSAGVYYKKIDDPIEKISSSPYDSATRSIYTTNSDKAELWGVEAEILKNLSFLGEGKALENIYLYANGTINETTVTSYVNTDGTGGLYEANRPLYGQSPYSYNLGLDYIGDRLSFNIRYNGSGDQYLLVGFDYKDEEIRRPYAVADAQISYRFFKEKNFEVKCSAQNIFDRVLETYNNQNSYSSLAGEQTGKNPRDQYQLGMGATKKYDEDIDRVLFRSYTGRTIKFSLTYNF